MPDHLINRPTRLLRSGAGSALRALALAALLPGAILAQQANEGLARPVRLSGSSAPLDPLSIPRPVLQAHRIDDSEIADLPIVLDGVPDEDLWFQADSATDFVQALPFQGLPASERTVVRVLFDGRNLYVGATMYDREPERLTSPGLQQDFSTHDSDMFSVAIDSHLDRRNGIMFGVNPAGALFDAQSFDDSRSVNRSWEGVVHTGTRVHEWGWTAEMVIPFTTLRFEEKEEGVEFGMNFIRRIRRLNEDSYWAPVSRQYRVHKFSLAGTLTGLEDLQQGRNLMLKPYVNSSYLDGSIPVDLGRDGWDPNIGGDLKYGVTSQLALDLTVNTDFSQVEVDQEQVNLTRFSLFFPEKRDFFMEGQGTYILGDVAERNYRTGSGPTTFRLFHSRRIGLSDDRRPIPIIAGARMTGRVGDSTELGALNMQTQDFGEYPAENFTVLRLRQNIFGGGDVGAMFVNRQATAAGYRDQYNRSLGIDTNFRFFDYLILNGYYARTEDWEKKGDSNSAWLQAAWRDPLWDASAYVKHVGDAFTPDVGFVQRTAMREVFGTFGAHPQPDIPWVQEMNPYVDGRYIENLDGVIETRSIKAGIITQFIPGDRFSIDYEERFERLLTPENIVGVEVPAGDYSFGDLSTSLSFTGARRLSGRVRFATGGFFNGDKTSYGVGATARYNEHLSLELTADRNDIVLSGEEVAANVYGGRIAFAASTTIFLSSFVQWNEASDELVSNIRFNFIHSPLSDVFLVFQERRDLTDNQVLDRLLTLKVTKLFQF